MIFTEVNSFNFFFSLADISAKYQNMESWLIYGDNF